MLSLSSRDGGNAAAVTPWPHSVCSRRRVHVVALLGNALFRSFHRGARAAIVGNASFRSFISFVHFVKEEVIVERGRPSKSSCRGPSRFAMH